MSCMTLLLTCRDLTDLLVNSWAIPPSSSSLRQGSCTTRREMREMAQSALRSADALTEALPSWLVTVSSSLLSLSPFNFRPPLAALHPAPPCLLVDPFSPLVFSQLPHSSLSDPPCSVLSLHLLSPSFFAHLFFHAVQGSTCNVGGSSRSHCCARSHLSSCQDLILSSLASSLSLLLFNGSLLPLLPLLCFLTSSPSLPSYLNSLNCSAPTCENSQHLLARSRLLTIDSRRPQSQALSSSKRHRYHRLLEGRPTRRRRKAEQPRQIPCERRRE